MKLFLFIFTVFLLALFAYGSPAKDTRLGTPSPGFQNKCAKACPDNYKPICASDGKDKKSFGNECVMSVYNCEHNTKLEKISDAVCPGGGGVRLS